MGGTALAVGGSLLGGMISSSSASSAASKAASAETYAADVQYKMWKEANDQMLPYIQAGTFGVQSLQALASGQTVGGTVGTAPTIGTGTTTGQTQQIMPVGGPSGYLPDTAASVASPMISQVQNTFANPPQAQTMPSASDLVYDPEVGYSRDQYGNYYQTNIRGEVKPAPGYPTYPTGTTQQQQAAPATQGQTAAQTAPVQPPAGMVSEVGNMGNISNQVQNYQLTQAPDASWTIDPVTGEITMGNTQATSAGGQGGLMSPELPDLPGQVDFQFDETDPVYQFKLQQLNEQTNRALSARGLYDSRTGMNVLADTNMGLISSEADKQYQRLVDERNYLAQRASNLYEMAVNRGNTLYDRIYTQQQDLYNRTYNQGMTEDARGMALLQDKYNMSNANYQRDYGMYLDLAKIGAGSAASAGAQSGSTAQGMASSLANAGAYNAQGTLLSGNTLANMFSGLGTTIGNAMNTGNTNTYYGQSAPGWDAMY